MRTIREIDAEVAACRARLNELMIEREDVRGAELATIRAMFLAGKSRRDIARDLRMTPAAVAGALYRAGLSDTARDQMRARGSAAGPDDGATGRPRLRRGGGSGDFSQISLAGRHEFGDQTTRDRTDAFHATQHGDDAWKKLRNGLRAKVAENEPWPR